MSSWFKRLKSRYPNVHVSWAYRGADDQDRFFKEGKSQLRYPLSAHNATLYGKPCSRALDLFQIDEDGVARFSEPFYAKVNDENEAAQEPITWGGTWKSLGDKDHFERKA